MPTPTDTTAPSSDALTSAPVGTRRPYESPAVIEDLPLETYSLACVKDATTCGIPVATS